jgi:hypothetical protein
VDPVRRSVQLSWHGGRFAAALALAALATVVAMGSARAAADEEAKKLTADALEQIRYKKYELALEALAKAQQLCRSRGCDAAVKSEVYVTQGVAYAISGDAKNARTRFEWALAEQSGAAPPERYATKAVRSAFEDAKKNVDAGKGAKPPQPAGQLSADQRECIANAKQQLEAKDWEACFQTMIVCLSGGDFAAGKLMLARCQDLGGVLLEARKDAQLAKELAKGDGDDGLTKEINEYLDSLENEIPKIRLKLPAGLGKPTVKLDNQPVDVEKLKEPVEHNPGSATVSVSGERDRLPLKCKTVELKFERRETIDYTIDCPPYEACLAAARTPAEKRKCDATFGAGERLTFRAGLEVASYNDNDNVDVLSPSIFAGAVDPTQGWNVSALATVDVVTTASADIVATASRRFDEVRVAASLGGGYRVIKGSDAVGPVTVGLNGGFSIEPDYVGRTVGGSVTVDVWERMLSPYVSYNFGFDIIGRADTEFDIFSRDVRRHTIGSGLSFVLTSSTLAVLAGTFEILDGDYSKPYRHVATFLPEAVDDLPRGATPQLVSSVRLDYMPLEQLPDERLRWAVLVRVSQRFDTATLRADERLYMDSWGQMASTTDARFLWDFYTADDGHPALRAGPHARFHIQGPVDFWQRAYAATPTPTGFEGPAFRTGDRELGPLFSATGGLGLRAGLTEALSLGIEANGIYTQFLDHLYIFDRVGVFTASTMELELR